MVQLPSVQLIVILFTADRAKAIKTKAVINESPTEKLIRELREENERLLNALKAGGLPLEAQQQEQQQQQQQSGIPEEGLVLRFQLKSIPLKKECQ